MGADLLVVHLRIRAAGSDHHSRGLQARGPIWVPRWNDRILGAVSRTEPHLSNQLNIRDRRGVPVPTAIARGGRSRSLPRRLGLGSDYVSARAGTVPQAL
jgi:hypothetical protein